MPETMARNFGCALLATAVLAGLGAPVVAPHAPDRTDNRLQNAPPTTIHLRDGRGTWQRPFIYRWTLVSRLEQRFDEDRADAFPLVWMSRGHLVSSSDDERAPLLVLGADGFGRDVFSRLVFGARASLGLALVAALAATLLGAVVGGTAGFLGGFADDVLMRVTEFVLLLPTIYVVLALRAALPLVLGADVIFLLLAAIFAVVGAPFVARGVRAIVRSERRLEYAAAAESLGAGPVRVLLRHLLPAAAGFVAVQITILIPAFIVAEATLSFVGLGFPDTLASWGVMLHDASNVSAMAQRPWLLSPAAAIFGVVLGVNLILQASAAGPGEGALPPWTILRRASPLK